MGLQCHTGRKQREQEGYRLAALEVQESALEEEKLDLAMQRRCLEQGVSPHELQRLRRKVPAVKTNVRHCEIFHVIPADFAVTQQKRDCSCWIFGVFKCGVCHGLALPKRGSGKCFCGNWHDYYNHLSRPYFSL